MAFTRSRATLALATTIVAMVAATGAVASTDGTLPATAGFPESIAVQPGSSTYFVSSFTTGAVFRGTAGHPARLFLPGGEEGRSSAAGVKFDGADRLMVLSGSQQLQVYSSRTGRHQATFA